MQTIALVALVPVFVALIAVVVDLGRVALRGCPAEEDLLAEVRNRRLSDAPSTRAGAAVRGAAADLTWLVAIGAVVAACFGAAFVLTGLT